MLSLVRFMLGLGGSGSDAVEGGSGQAEYPSLILNFINDSYEVYPPYTLDLNFTADTYFVRD
jgi:hypothetical protein